MADPQPTACAPKTTDFRQTWDTSYVPRTERFSYFREGICQAFLAVSPETLSDTTCEARIGMAQLPRGRISKVRVTPHRASRTKSDLAKIDGEYLSLGLQVTGGVRFNLSGKPLIQSTGDIALVHSNNIGDWESGKNGIYTRLGLLFYKSQLKDFVNLPDIYYLTPAYKNTMSLCLSLINEKYESSSKVEMTNLFDAALSLLTASLVQDRDYLEDRCSNDASVRRGIAHTIRAFISREISDPDLSTTSVADHFGISVRYIQKLFAAEGTTLKSFIIDTRLAKVRADLLDPTVAHIPSGDIAFRWGFRDMTTFHRNFKLRFGHAPGQLRAPKQSGG